MFGKSKRFSYSTPTVASPSPADYNICSPKKDRGFSIHKSPRFPNDYYDPLIKTSTSHAKYIDVLKKNVLRFDEMHAGESLHSNQNGSSNVRNMIRIYEDLFPANDGYIFDDYDSFTTPEEQEELVSLEAYEKEEIRKELQKRRSLGEREQMEKLFKLKSQCNNEMARMKYLQSYVQNQNKHQATDDQREEMEIIISKAIEALRTQFRLETNSLLEKAEERMHILVTEFFDAVQRDTAKEINEDGAVELMNKLEDTIESTGLKLKTNRYCDTLIRNVSDIILGKTELSETARGEFGSGSLRRQKSVRSRRS